MVVSRRLALRQRSQPRCRPSPVAGGATLGGTVLCSSAWAPMSPDRGGNLDSQARNSNGNTLQPGQPFPTAGSSTLNLGNVTNSTRLPHSLNAVLCHRRSRSTSTANLARPPVLSGDLRPGKFTTRSLVHGHVGLPIGILDIAGSLANPYGNPCPRPEFAQRQVLDPGSLPALKLIPC